MFLCQQCQRQTQRHEKACALVVTSRMHVHPPRSYLVRGESKPRADPGGSGPQIVRELRVCAACRANADFMSAFSNS